MILAYRAEAVVAARIIKRTAGMLAIEGDIVGKHLFGVDRFVGMRQTARATRDLRPTIAAVATNPIVDRMRTDGQRAVTRQENPGSEAAVMWLVWHDLVGRCYCNSIATTPYDKHVVRLGQRPSPSLFRFSQKVTAGSN
jgi:hypothetical protein